MGRSLFIKQNMPYKDASDPKLPERIKKLSSKIRKRWVAVWNNVYKDCVDKGGGVSECEGKAFRISNGVIKKREFGMSWVDKLAGSIVRMFQEDPDLFKLVENEIHKGEKVERAIGVDNLATKVLQALRDKIKESEDDDYYWSYSFQRLMIDGGRYYAVFNKSGELYRSYVTVSNGAVTLGDFEAVEEDYKPVQQSSLRVHRQKDGRCRITMIAATSVLNRDREIDSSKLFDNFIKHSEELELRPLIDFYHLGQRNSTFFDIGEIDLQTRVGVTYITSGIIDETKPLGRAVVRALDQDESKTKNWGCSIEYYPVLGSTEKISLDDDTEAHVYLDGINTRVTILPEKDAASLFTGIYKERSVMGLELDERQKKALRSVFETEDEFDMFLKNIEDVNEEVVDRGLVHRESQDEEDSELPTEEDTEEQPVSGVIELDDQLVGTIVDMVVERMQDKEEKDNPALETIQETLQNLSAQVSGMIEISQQLTSRVKDLEVDEEVKKEQYIQDLPQKSKDDKVLVTYKPSQRSNEETKEIVGNFNEIAAETLNSIPRPSKRN